MFGAISAAAAELPPSDLSSVNLALGECQDILGVSPGDASAAPTLSWMLLPLKDRLSLLRGVAEGMEFLHGRGVVHRDLKLANVFLDGPTPRVGDFGTAKAWDTDHHLADEAVPDLARLASSSSDSSAHSQPRIIGTDAYIAPEVWSGSAVPGPAADVWSFGMCLFALLDSELVDPLERVLCRSGLEGSPVQEVLLVHHIVPSLSDLLDDHCLPPAVSKATISEASSPWGATQLLLSRCLQFDPSKRPSMSQVSAQLSDVISLCEA